MAEATEAISGYGTSLVGATTGTVLYITSIAPGGSEVNNIEVSTMASTNSRKEFIAGMIDSGTIEVQVLYEDSIYTLLDTNIGLASEVWTVTWTDGATFVCNGYISNIGAIDSPMDGAVTHSLTIKLTGDVTYTPVV